MGQARQVRFIIPFYFLVDQDTESVALYAEGTFAVTEKVSTVVGVRWSRDKKDANQFVVGNILPATCRDLEFSDDWSSTTPKIALEYDYSENVLIYASATKGFKGGGLNPFGCGNDYDQEELLSYELGYKGRLASGRMNLNMTVFYYDYEDMQVQVRWSGPFGQFEGKAKDCFRVGSSPSC